MRWELVGLALCGALLVWLIASGPSSREGTSTPPDRFAAPTAEDAARHGDAIQIEGLDWEALGSWARDNAALKNKEGKWVGVDMLLAGLGEFVHEASKSPGSDTIDREHLEDLAEGLRAWGKAETNWAEFVARGLMEASEKPGTWGRLVRALGPGLMAGLYDEAQERRPRVVEELERVESELAAAEGEARKKLENERGDLETALAAIDRLQEPDDSARASWQRIKVALGSNEKAPGSRQESGGSANRKK